MPSWQNLQEQPLLEAGPLIRHPAAARRGCEKALETTGLPVAGAEGQSVGVE